MARLCAILTLFMLTKSFVTEMISVAVKRTRFCPIDVDEKSFVAADLWPPATAHPGVASQTNLCCSGLARCLSRWRRGEIARGQMCVDRKHVSIHASCCLAAVF